MQPDLAVSVPAGEAQIVAAGRDREKAEAFAEALRERFGVPVHLHDERLTTREAEEIHGHDNPRLAELLQAATPQP